VASATNSKACKVRLTRAKAKAKDNGEGTCNAMRQGRGIGCDKVVAGFLETVTRTCRMRPNAKRRGTGKEAGTSSTASIWSGCQHSMRSEDYCQAVSVLGIVRLGSEQCAWPAGVIGAFTFFGAVFVSFPTGGRSRPRTDRVSSAVRRM
jgi:hypothetical protein